MRLRSPAACFARCLFGATLLVAAGCGDSSSPGSPSGMGGSGGSSSGSSSGAGTGSSSSGSTSGSSSGSSSGAGGNDASTGGSGSSSGSAGDASMGGSSSGSSDDAGGSDGSDGAAASDAPSTGTGSGAVIIWGVGEHPTPAMMANPTPAAEDTTMQTQLQAKGLTVDMVQDAKATPATLAGKALFVVSSSVDRTSVMPSIKDVTVPAIVSKDGVLEPFGMASATSVNAMGTQIAIALPSDPLAAGLMGTITATTKTDRLIASTVGASATKVATLVGMPAQVAIYYYSAGQMMATGTAPAKRVGFFIHRDTDLSPDGIKLFDAAVAWCLQP